MITLMRPISAAAIGGLSVLPSETWFDLLVPTAHETTIVESLRACRVVPVVTIEDPATAVPVGTALRDGGVGCIEITFRHAAAAEALRRAREVDGLLVGAGTILSVEQAQTAFAAGAQFAVAPGTNPDVVECCRALGLPFFPGVATPSEIERARQLECFVVKVFPAVQLGGPEFLQAVSATYPDVSFIPTGGIDAGSLGDYLAVPSVVACGGSWLARPEAVRAGRFDEIERLARETRESFA